MYEECQAGIILLEKKLKIITPKHLLQFVGWIDKYVENWAVCDSFCLKIISKYYESYTSTLSDLYSRADSSNRWRRRAACVTLSKLTRTGRYYKEAFKLTELLLEDKDIIVLKGVGWLLKEASRCRTEEVIKFLNRNKSGIPQVVKSYAKEKMTSAQKARVL